MSETKDRGKRIKEKYMLLAKNKTPASERKPKRNFEFAKPNTIAPF